MRRTVTYRVDLDERGEFRATVYNDAETVLTSIDTEDAVFLVECMGFKHLRDARSIKEYLVGMDMMGERDHLVVEG
jgi:hypothetical protein